MLPRDLKHADFEAAPGRGGAKDVDSPPPSALVRVQAMQDACKGVVYRRRVQVSRRVPGLRSC